jgi:hypothetical protein
MVRSFNLTHGRPPSLIFPAFNFVRKGKFHDQGEAKWIVIRGQLKGHNDTPFGRPTPGRPIDRPAQFFQNPIRFEMRDFEVEDEDLFLFRAAILGLEMRKSKKILERFFQFVFYVFFNKDQLK